MLTLDLIEPVSQLLGQEPDYCRLSSNPNLTIDYLRSSIEKPWRWLNLTYNMDLDVIQRNGDLPWDAIWLHHKMQMVPFEEILNKTPEHTLDYGSLSFNASVPIQYVLDNRTMPWDWRGVSMWLVKDLETVLHNVDLPWSWYGLASNTNLSFEKDVLGNLNLPWNWGGLSLHMAKIKDVLDNPDLPWDWEALSMSVNLEIQDVIEHVLPRIQLPMLFGFMPHNPTLDAVETHPDLDWQWCKISCSASTLDIKVDSDEYSKAVRRHLAARRLARQFRRAMSDPSYDMCRRRLLREHQELIDESKSGDTGSCRRLSTRLPRTSGTDQPATS
jgi:hypothetical protein